MGPRRRSLRNELSRSVDSRRCSADCDPSGDVTSGRRTFRLTVPGRDRGPRFAFHGRSSPLADQRRPSDDGRIDGTTDLWRDERCPSAATTGLVLLMAVRGDVVGGPLRSFPPSTTTINGEASGDVSSRRSRRTVVESPSPLLLIGRRTLSDGGLSTGRRSCRSADGALVFGGERGGFSSSLFFERTSDDVSVSALTHQTPHL